MICNSRSSSHPPTHIHLKPLLIIPHVRILPLRLRNHHVRDHGPENITLEKYPEHVRQANHVGSAEVVEEEGREDGAEFTGSGAHAVAEAAHAGWEDFGGDDEGGGVGAEVEEELGGTKGLLGGVYGVFWK